MANTARGAAAMRVKMLVVSFMVMACVTWLVVEVRLEVEVC